MNQDLKDLADQFDPTVLGTLNTVASKIRYGAQVRADEMAQDLIQYISEKHLKGDYEDLVAFKVEHPYEMQWRSWITVLCGAMASKMGDADVERAVKQLSEIVLKDCSHE